MASSSIRGALPWRAGQYLTRSNLRTLRLVNTRQFSKSSSFRSGDNASPSNPLRSQSSGLARYEGQAGQYKRSMMYSAAGMLACTVAIYGMIKLDVFGLQAIEEATKDETAADEKTFTEDVSPSSKNGAMKMEGPSGFPESAGPSVIPIQGQEGIEQIATGNSTVPYFPTTIRLPAVSETEGKKSGDELSATDGDEYQLLGLGIRTVSFLSIQVYVVGLYVAKKDISELQQRLVRTAIHPPAVGTNDPPAPVSGAAAAATSLVPPERQQLKEILLDAERGDAAWTALLKDEGIRTAFRIVPTRNTDFMHLRDGWVRGITGRAQQQKKRPVSDGASEFQDEAFGSAMNDFKAVFGGNQRKSVPKGQTLVLVRNAHGALDALFQADPQKPMRWMGRVADERVSRLVWLNYLAGKTVSSEGARKSIVDGLMMIAERPIGTVVP